MHTAKFDFYVTGTGLSDGYLLAPAGTAPPDDVATALGGAALAWTQELGRMAAVPAWRAVRSDLDACGYAVLSREEFAALLLWVASDRRAWQGQVP